MAECLRCTRDTSNSNRLCKPCAMLQDCEAQLATANKRIEALTEFVEWIVASHEEGDGIPATQNAIANIYLRVREVLAGSIGAGEATSLPG